MQPFCIRLHYQSIFCSCRTDSIVDFNNVGNGEATFLSMFPQQGFIFRTLHTENFISCNITLRPLNAIHLF